MRIYIDCCERSQVQRIVITSSTSAIVSLPLSKSTVFSEQDWNLSDIKQVQEMGAYGVYCTAKTLAEKGGVFFFVFRSPLLQCFLKISCLGFL